jgi:hypothetical protein
VNARRPDWKPIIALARPPDSSCSAKYSMQCAVSPLAAVDRRDAAPHRAAAGGHQ